MYDKGAPWGGKHAGQTHRIPMTYMDNGKQYIVAALKADGGNGRGELIAYALPVGIEAVGGWAGVCAQTAYRKGHFCDA